MVKRRLSPSSLKNGPLMDSFRPFANVNVDVVVVVVIAVVVVVVLVDVAEVVAVVAALLKS